jgi:predicted porin
VNSKGGAGQRLSIENDRQDNTVRYDSPVINGFSVSMNYSLKADSAKAGANVGYGITGKYVNGPLMLAAGYDKPNDTAGSNSTDPKLSSAMFDSNFWFVGASYKFGPTRISGSYLKGTDKKDGFASQDVKQVVLGLTHTIGAGDIRLAYDRITANSNSDRKVELGYWHHLSKRTDLWASIAHMSGDNVDTDFLSGSSVSAAFGRSSGIGFGMQHKF